MAFLLEVHPSISLISLSVMKKKRKTHICRLKLHISLYKYMNKTQISGRRRGTRGGGEKGK